jgi:hypothetical protein
MRMLLEKETSVETFHILKRIFKIVKKRSDEERWGTEADISIQDNVLFLYYETHSGKGVYNLEVSLKQDQSVGAEPELYTHFSVEFSGYRNSFLGGTLGWKFQNIPEFPKPDLTYNQAQQEGLSMADKLVDIVFGVAPGVNFTIAMTIVAYETSMPEKALKWPDPIEIQEEKPGIVERIGARIRNAIHELHWRKGDYQVPAELEELKDISELEDLEIEELEDLELVEE